MLIVNWYMVVGWDIGIHEVRVRQEYPDRLTLFDGTMVRKRSREAHYFPTRRDAILYLIRRSASSIAHHRDGLNVAESDHAYATKLLKEYDDADNIPPVVGDPGQHQ